MEVTKRIVESTDEDRNDVSSSKDSHEDRTSGLYTEDQRSITSAEENEHAQGEDKDDKNMQEGDASKEIFCERDKY